MNYKNDKVKLEKASKKNIELLIIWTLDKVAQGPYKRISYLTVKELETLFLNSIDREYFSDSK